jgi:hypothetical protein
LRSASVSHGSYLLRKMNGCLVKFMNQNPLPEHELLRIDEEPEGLDRDDNTLILLRLRKIRNWDNIRWLIGPFQRIMNWRIGTILAMLQPMDAWYCGRGAGTLYDHQLKLTNNY